MLVYKNVADFNYEPKEINSAPEKGNPPRRSLAFAKGKSAFRTAKGWLLRSKSVFLARATAPVTVCIKEASEDAPLKVLIIAFVQ